MFDRRVTAWWCLLFLLGIPFLGACYATKPVGRSELESLDASKHQLLLTYPTGNVTVLEKWTLEYPFLVGIYEEGNGVLPGEPVEKYPTLRRFNLDEATKIEVYKRSPGRIAGLTVGALAGAVAFTALLFSAMSCPTVYVVDGAREVIAGEAYPGATFRSLQRDDLLALPPVDGPSLTLRLSNNNPEIQYTDSARVVLVPHTPAQRALATHDGRAMLVEGSQAALRATDLEGVDVLDLIRAADGAVWQSDLDRAFLAGRRELREGLVVTFGRSEGNMAMEITAENTLWMTAVFQHGYSMLGNAFGPAMNAGNKAERAGIEAWRAREGVDLRVEVLRDGVWTQAAMVQTPGVAALRTMLVPIGAVDTDELQVRLSGGFGFWRIGSVALTTIVDDSPETTVITATNDPVGAKDGNYHVLSEYGQSVDLTFALPESSSPRTAFLASSGWYNALPPKRKLPQLAALNKLRTTPGGLAQLGLDLYARHREHIHQEPAP